MPASAPETRSLSSEPALRDTRISLAHGAGGRAMQSLIRELLVETLYRDPPEALEDQAAVQLGHQGDEQGRPARPLTDQAPAGRRIAMTTDSYVVDPLVFPGGDIGKLAVAGTVNDLAVGGALPSHLTCSLIIEEGLSIALLRQIMQSMRATADEAGVSIVTGDTKVVPKGKADKLFVNTAGIGVIPTDRRLSSTAAQPGDRVIINGYIGDHAAAIAGARQDLGIQCDVVSDCQPLNALVERMLLACPEIRCIRDATRGGLATVLNEFADASQCSVSLDEATIPVRSEVRGLCEILGLDPLYMANEGKLVAIVPECHAEAVIDAMKQQPAGQHAAIVGTITAAPAGRVILQTSFGSQRVVQMLNGEQLPRIC